jgi:transcriptional regulator of arginine metabolism
MSILRRSAWSRPTGSPMVGVQMTSKHERQSAIRALLSEHQVGSQEELRQLLAARGVSITQATLSRDLREMGVVRSARPTGARYVLPATLVDESKPSLDNLLPQLFSHIDGVGELLVLHTLPSGAQPIAEAIDAQGWTEAIGTIAGENTILIVCRSSAARLALAERLVALSQRR